MSNPLFAELSVEELVRLALEAGQHEDGAAALACLKEAAGRPDASAVAHYLLGAEYAQIGMPEAAIDCLEAALALDPRLATARLQLGLLWIVRGGAAQAQTALAPLQELAADDPMRAFGAGLTDLVADRLHEAADGLARGLALNGDNAALNQDMQRLREAVLAQLATAEPTPTPEAGAEDETRHLWLSAYTGNVRH